jgi:hypothetical protein
LQRRGTIIPTEEAVLILALLGLGTIVENLALKKYIRKEPLIVLYCTVFGGLLDYKS